MTSDEIKELVESKTSLVLKTKIRTTEYNIARGLFFSLCRKNTNETSTRLSSYYNNNHTSVLRAVSTFDNVYYHDKEVKAMFIELDGIINKKQPRVTSTFGLSEEMLRLVVNEIKDYDDCDIINLIEYRIKPYSKMLGL